MQRFKTVITFRLKILWTNLVKLNGVGFQFAIVVLERLEHIKSKDLADAHIFNFKLLFESFVAPNQIKRA